MNSLTISNFPPLEYACSEALNTLCTNISYCGSDIQVVMLTSRYEQEGKSSISMNIMRTLAGFGKRVLLIDSDLRCSALVRRYRFTFSEESGACGLSQYLAGMCELEDAVYQTDIHNAFILPVGHEVLNSMQLLTSARFGKMMTILRRNFDMIIVDTPPAGVIVDAVEIAKYCDGAVLVVSSNRGRNQDITEVVSSISRTGCPVLGAVLNGVELKSFSNRNYYYRSERYASYYHHGYGAVPGQSGKSNSRKGSSK